MVEGREQPGAIFNMAIAQLQLLNGILRNIANLGSVYSEEGGEDTLTPGQAQHLKYRWVRQLYIQSIPLFDIKTDAEWKKKVYTKIKNVTLLFIPKYRDCKLIGKSEGYNKELDNLLDDLVIEIQERLQTHKYFMPPKSDPRFAWSQD